MVIFITGKQNGSYHRKLPASLLVLALILIEDLGFLPLVPLRSTRGKTEFLTLVEKIPDLQ
jgi:hypothetical protein